MAEALGTVVGVVSLGFQVCSSINTYLDGVQCRKEDLEHTTRWCKSMEALLKQIESIQTRISSVTGVNKTTIDEAMADAKAELSLLDDFVKEIFAGNTTSSSRSATEKIKDQQRRFLYPFRKDHLYRLNDRLRTANGTLCSALQLAGLEISLTQGHTLHGLQTSLNSLTQSVSNMHLELNTAVRQLHSDATTSHLALANIEKNSNETTSLLTMSHNDTVSFRDDPSEMKTMLAALMYSDGRAILPKLVSKPDALRKISDIAGIGSLDKEPGLPVQYHAEQILNSRDYPEFQCTCNPRRLSKGRRQRIGLASVEQKRVTGNVHAPRCQLACFPMQLNDKWSLSISVRALGRIVHAGLTISMSATFGAGGFGLSPSFTYFTVRENSPALKVLCLLGEAFQQRAWSDEENDHLLQRGIKTLQVTMTARKWSPFDVDSNGDDVLAPTILFIHGQVNRLRIITFLLSLGAPRDRPNDYGFFPFHTYITFGRTEQKIAEAFDLLWADGIDLMRHGMQSTPGGHINVEEMVNYKGAVSISANMRKLYENHLMQAIIEESKPMLLDNVDKGLITLQLLEKDPFGRKMLYYLFGWPEGLRTVFEQCGNCVLDLTDHGQCIQEHIVLLECALKWSGKLCMSSDFEYCSEECTCAEAVKPILEAERSYPLKRRQHQNWVSAMLSASAKARALVIQDLRRRREELKQLGLLYLSLKQIDWMGLRKPEVLDYYTAEALHALKAVGIPVPPRLETEFEAVAVQEDEKLSHCTSGSHELGVDGPFSSKGASVYHILGASPHTAGGSTGVRALASSLYFQGFRDIDVVDCTGVTPLTGRYAENPILDIMQWNWATSIECWLIEHSASLETQIPNRVTGYNATHQLFRWIGLQGGFTKERSPFQLIHSSWESAEGFTQQILDACRCKCSIGGCNPYNIMWKILLQRLHGKWSKLPAWWYQWMESLYLIPLVKRPHFEYSGDDERQRLTTFIVEETSFLEEACDLPWHVKCICLRACTFEMLPLRHTCCDKGHRRCDDEEISEIWDEDQTEIGRLEDLMDEFEKKLEEMDCSLTEFYRAYWIERMNEVLRQMDEQSLTAKGIEDLERVGVRLRTETEASGLDKMEIEDRNSLEYWVQKMDELAE